MVVTPKRCYICGFLAQTAGCKVSSLGFFSFKPIENDRQRRAWNKGEILFHFSWWMGNMMRLSMRCPIASGGTHGKYEGPGPADCQLVRPGHHPDSAAEIVKHVVAEAVCRSFSSKPLMVGHPSMSLNSL